jgi:hypothetical protein
MIFPLACQPSSHTISDHDSRYHIVFTVFTYCSCMPWDAGAAHSVTHIPVAEPLQLLSPVVKQQTPVVLLFGQGVEAVTHYDTAGMLSLWLWGPRAPALPDVGIATEPVVWFREFVLDTVVIPVTVPEIHHHTLSISHYVCTIKLIVKILTSKGTKTMTTFHTEQRGKEMQT